MGRQEKDSMFSSRKKIMHKFSTLVEKNTHTHAHMRAHTHVLWLSGQLDDVLMKEEGGRGERVILCICVCQGL